eukprot:TRINITY_DN2558_c0_g1_i1.p1 TRINITY_DN2558_c0_g1~~TRINITY_DN2558_c0_g1_i1.p1  ORF type:complete len:460 (-),score=80.00 TRINITY_DN2558_c0_g1_i1:255-1604(-)
MSDYDEFDDNDNDNDDLNDDQSMGHSEEEDDDELLSYQGQPAKKPEDKIAELYRSMKPTEFEKRQIDMTKTVAELCAYPPDIAELLLVFYKWNVDQIQTNYFEDPDDVCRKAGVLYRADSSSIPKEKFVIECAICMEDVPSSQIFRLGCGHEPYCMTCWKLHIREKMKEGMFFVNCMRPKCRILLSDSAYKLLADLEDHNKFRKAIRRSLVNLNPKMRCCPNPRLCNNIIEYTGPGTSRDTVTCTGCHYIFCFNCEREKHKPVTCEQMELWEEKARDPASKETMNWITANTKPCPKCKKHIFKDEGCNHMTCRPPSGCGHEFCWLCRGDWGEHGQHTGGYYSCNKYEVSTAKKDDDEAAKVRSELERYLHFYNRYHNYHSDVVNSSEKKLKNAREKVTQFRSDPNPKRYGVNPDFIIRAVELEVECRKVLKYTYILAYFLEKNPKKKFL